ncbi:MAG: ABC transporter ATP-binding protein [Proteobacteria bacterium]|nr:ABC transporter ATP-binding protein [Pseudomonadota bacterium]MBU4259893.1 ABC transporter ATP-binding protein [Pseudomonadota bacterium]MBU4288945.1 ABC transporter ATP-binding protein [Pseudomonadota bacterium]MBU4415513.1 ABC transporter ATP-binding protein [Pseudomonadota bacterium]MCG2759082.1 ABC transporter ATP-binding protein [Desulfobacteraceae bacterium]
MFLQIEELKVEVGNKTILQNVNMEIPKGETHILFGPNGSGKTSLMMTIMGFSDYNVTHGKITFKGRDITYMPIHERARLGIGVSFQRPPTINGLKTRSIVEICSGGRPIDVDELSKQLKFSDFLDRDVNKNFSGGEIKRSELLQLTAQQPDLLLLDEPESGVDLESIVLIGNTINLLLGRGIECPKEQPHKNIVKEKTKSALVITHTGHILDYITADKGQVLYNGVLCCSRNAREILKWIREYGYEECVRCTI